MKKAIAEVPDDSGLKRGLRYLLRARARARDKEKGNVISNPKVEVLLDALLQRETWDESIGYLEDKLDQEQDAEKKQAIRDAISDARDAQLVDMMRQY